MSVATLELQEVFSKVRDQLNDKLIEREGEVDVVLTAMACREHALFVGPPGTAKSMLLDAIAELVDGQRFLYLLTKETDQDELFGPVKLSELKKDLYVRNIDKSLATAHVAFLDELFEGSSGVLNSVLKVLNERTYNNGNTTVQCPLLTCVAGSNKWPHGHKSGKEVAALFDRFLFRKQVKPIGTDRGLSKLLWEPSLEIELKERLTPAQMDEVVEAVKMVPWKSDAKDCFQSIIKEIRRQGVTPGDRRMRKAVNATQAFAWINGALEVEDEHLEILAHVLWEDPEEQPAVVTKVIGKLANPVGLQVNTLLIEADQIVSETDATQLDQAAMATKKLGEIVKKLDKLKGDKASRATEYVRNNQADIHRRGIDAI